MSAETSGSVSIDGNSIFALVFLVEGNPECSDAVRHWIYHQYQDPTSSPLPGIQFARKILGRRAANRHARTLLDRFEEIGGGTSLNRLSQEQATEITNRVQRGITVAGVSPVISFVCSRYGSPGLAETLTSMKEAGVTDALFVPTSPFFNSFRSREADPMWHSIQTAARTDGWVFKVAPDFAVSDGFTHAINDRIDQALQRFPRHVRRETHLLFSARGKRRSSQPLGKGLYCCDVHRSVQAIMDLRLKENERQESFSIAYRNLGSSADWLVPSDRAEMARLSKRQTRSVLVIPVDTVADSLECIWNLDVRLRKFGKDCGVSHYHLASGVNCHPFFTRMLSENILPFVNGEEDETGVPGHDTVSCPGTFSGASRREQARCHRCTLRAQ